jgi:hypothetical protein
MYAMKKLKRPVGSTLLLLLPYRLVKNTPVTRE